MKLSEIVPWGRSLAEYQLMFSLTDADLSRKILGCGDGPVIQEFSGAGYNVQVLPVEYEFQRGGDRMLKISKSD
jgi:hypothetical protein